MRCTYNLSIILYTAYIHTCSSITSIHLVQFMHRLNVDVRTYVCTVRAIILTHKYYNNDNMYIGTYVRT